MQPDLLNAARSGPTTGQGLAIARTTIEQHGGSIECASAPGHGTTFTLRIPVERRPGTPARAA